MALAVGVLGSNTAGAGGISLYEVGSFNSVDRFFFAANLNWKF